MSPRILLVLGVVALGACTTTESSGSGGGVGAAEVMVQDPSMGAAQAAGGAATANADDDDAFAADAADEVDARPPAESVVMIGDSITVASLAALDERFTELGHPDATIEAQVGKRIASSSGGNRSGVLVASELLREVEDTGDLDHSDALWIVALGTNDINQYGSDDELTEVVEELIEVVPSEARLIWVDTYHGGDVVGSDEVNRAIVRALAERGDGVLAAWSRVAADDESNLRSDLIHPSDQGTESFARLVAEVAEPLL